MAAFAATLRFVAGSQLLGTYVTRFEFVPGQWFARSVIDLKRDPASTCVVLGASNGREGFDPAILARNAPGTAFVNAATTGGNNEVVDIQSTILERYGLHPRCAIAAFSTWTMFRDGSPDLAAEEYLALLDWEGVLSLTSRPLLTRKGHHIAAGLMLPLRTNARQLNLLMRVSVSHARKRVLGPLPLNRYESYAGELQSPDTYNYQHTPSHLLADWDRLVARSRPFYPASRYGGAMQESAMRRSLDRLLRLTGGHVAIVVTPQTPILDPASRAAKPHFDRVVQAYAGQVALIDCTALRDMALFVDEGHLTADGRAILSAEVGQIVAAGVMSGRKGSSAHCTASPSSPAAKSVANSD
ncbi:hypothetical protein [Sphingomonas sp. SUN039]|uniref:hypothetical protein n=1 Tax=Sphingomonas sp. SUN039 TaxID=2937787 RepID=UPI002164252C|nr:hypothetical protein [Sphingomonas sp. SUN039]UVO52868.1 hypothetical protein M0209_01550 [Sphingomonas sp. SUN039]